MIARMKKTVANIMGEEFKKGEIVEVLDCWINNFSNKIYIQVKLNECKLITSIDHIEHIDRRDLNER